MSGSSAIDDVRHAAAEAAFGRPLVTNVLRAMIVEAIVDRALSSEWRWCSNDYAAWDFERVDGLRLEVKQAAARQSWATFEAGPSKAVFDIAARTGRWDGAVWVADPRRWADLYIFGHHPISDETADHRDPAQWRFYVVPTDALPHQKTLAISRLASLAVPCDVGGLRDAVDAASATRTRAA